GNSGKKGHYFCQRRVLIQNRGTFYLYYWKMGAVWGSTQGFYQNKTKNFLYSADKGENIKIAVKITAIAR
ncbi:hypothetical protein P4H94_13755, partial [Paenibacillus macerans]|uniref:hypothetical protein n=1 Tax=Paenibacillus macerans TaxID=44252 RepID=UPI002DB91E7E